MGRTNIPEPHGMKLKESKGLGSRKAKEGTKEPKESFPFKLQALPFRRASVGDGLLRISDKNRRSGLQVRSGMNIHTHVI